MFVLLHAFPKKTQKHLSEKSIKPFVKLKILGKGGLMMNNNAMRPLWSNLLKPGRHRVYLRSVLKN